MKTILIDGQWQTAASGETINVFNPSTGRVFTQLARGTKDEVDRAVQAARDTYHSVWRHISATERGRILLKLAGFIQDNAAEIAKRESEDTGKPRKLAESDVTALARYFEFYGMSADKHHADVIPYRKNFR